MEHTLAVLIDFENLVTGAQREDLGHFDVHAVFRRLKDKGRIAVARAYADWGRFARYKQVLLEQGVTMVELASHGGPTKNRADIALVVDAMELAFTRPYVDTFVILSGDSDFTPLVFRLRELDKRVIGLGTRRSTSRLIVYACDEFIFYDNLVRARDAEAHEARERGRREPLKAAEPESAQGDGLTLEQAFDLLVETLEGLLSDDPTPQLASMVKDTMRRKEPSFDQRELGYSGFGRFLEEAQRRGLVRLVRDDRANGFRVDLPGREATAPAQPAIGLEQAFDLLMETVEGLQQEDPNPVPASLVKQAMLRREPSFNERDLGFRGFGPFLEEAARRDLVAILRDERSGGYRVDFFSPAQPHPEE